MITLNIPGRPRTKGSMRHVGKGRMIEGNPHSSTWRADVRAAAMAQGCTAGEHAYSVEVRCWFKRPHNHRRANGELKPGSPRFPHGRVGDVDKIARNVLDALAGVVWHDDSQVVNVTASKAWADVQDYERTTITIKPMG